MKIFILVFLFVGASFAWENEWKTFKLKHGKTYVNITEEKHRFAIFKKALKQIAKHNKLFRARKVSWEQGITPFTDMTKEEFAAFLSHSGSLKMSKVATPLVAVPKVLAPVKINWRRKGKVSIVKDQGSCGSCWAFSTTGAIESQLLIKGKNYLLSEQQLIDCSTDNYGCNGGWADTSFDYIKKYGIEHQIFYPYKDKDGMCLYNRSRVATRVSGYYEGHNEVALKQLVGTHGPTSVSIDAYQLQNYKFGVFDTNNCTQINNHRFWLSDTIDN